MSLPTLIGMVHLLPLPGSPRYGGKMEPVVSHAVSDALTLAEAGFPALLAENQGDAPFFADRVPPSTVAAMTVAAAAVRDACGLPVGVNVLRNDASAALAVAAAMGAGFVRVNVLTGVMLTDQGTIEGRAAEVVREREILCPGVAILADVFVKHATPPPGSTIEQAAADTFLRGGADALVVSGSATGSPPPRERLAAVRRAVPGAPLLVGSGVTAANLVEFAALADGAIVGSSLKRELAGPVDSSLARAVVEAARAGGWL